VTSTLFISSGPNYAKGIPHLNVTYFNGPVYRTLKLVEQILTVSVSTGGIIEIWLATLLVFKNPAATACCKVSTTPGKHRWLLHDDLTNNNHFGQQKSFELSSLSIQRFQQYWSNSRDQQVPLDFLCRPNFWKAGIACDSIINAVGNIRRTEALSRKAQQDGKQNSKQAKKTEILHWAEVQRLAALTAEHAQLCYNFKNCELIFQELHWTEDSTCCWALQGCSEEVSLLLLPSSALNPVINNRPVIVVVNKWYLPGFTCSKQEFHTWIWQQASL
jgi:hypothetical protein